MSEAPPSRPRISASDRLGFTLFLTLILHAILVLGVGFTPSTPGKDEALPGLDVIVSNKSLALAPALDADPSSDATRRLAALGVDLGEQPRWG